MVLWPIRVLFELFYRGISSPEKSCNNTREKIRYFFTCVWYRQSAADTSHAFRATRSGWWMNGKAFTILNPRSFVRIFSDYFCLKSEIFVSTLTESDVQTFLEREENQKKTKRKTESYVFSGFGNGISRGWERKLTTGRFATGRFWPVTWMISSVGKDQFNNWKFCILKIRPIVCFCSDSTHVLILSAPTDFTICIRGLSILLFSFINRVDFSCQ